MRISLDLKFNLDKEHGTPDLEVRSLFDCTAEEYNRVADNTAEMLDRAAKAADEWRPLFTELFRTLFLTTSFKNLVFESVEHARTKLRQVFA